MIQFVKLITFTSLIFSVCCFAANAGNTIKVYKWVDEHGVTHFDQTPPLAMQKEIIKLSKTTSSAGQPTPAVTNSGASSSVAGKDSSPSKSGTKTVNSENCEIAKKNANILKNFAHIKLADEKGGFRYLSEEEKQQRITEADTMIQETCE